MSENSIELEDFSDKSLSGEMLGYDSFDEEEPEKPTLEKSTNAPPISHLYVDIDENLESNPPGVMQLNEQVKPLSSLRTLSTNSALVFDSAKRGIMEAKDEEKRSKTLVVDRSRERTLLPNIQENMTPLAQQHMRTLQKMNANAEGLGTINDENNTLSDSHSFEFESYDNASMKENDSMYMDTPMSSRSIIPGGREFRSSVPLNKSIPRKSINGAQNFDNEFVSGHSFDDEDDDFGGFGVSGNDFSNNGNLTPNKIVRVQDKNTRFMNVQRETRIRVRNAEYILKKKMTIENLIPTEHKQLIKYEADYRMDAAMSSRNQNKNRSKLTLPCENSIQFYNIEVDRNRVKLGRGMKSGTSSYINASFIENFSRKTNIIATQSPLESTIEDFWQMIYDQKVRFIISLVDYDNETDKRRLNRYWPQTGNHKRFQNFTLYGVSKSEGRMISRREIEIRPGRGGRRVVTIMNYPHWPDRRPPLSLPTIGMMVEDMKNAIEDDPGQYIVIQDKTGQDRAAVFIGCYLALTQIDKSYSFDLFEVATFLRRQMIDAFSSLVYYRTLYSFINLVVQRMNRLGK